MALRRRWSCGNPSGTSARPWLPSRWSRRSPELGLSGVVSSVMVYHVTRRPLLARAAGRDEVSRNDPCCSAWRRCSLSAIWSLAVPVDAGSGCTPSSRARCRGTGLAVAAALKLASEAAIRSSPAGCGTDAPETFSVAVAAVPCVGWRSVGSRLGGIVAGMRVALRIAVLGFGMPMSVVRRRRRDGVRHARGRRVAWNAPCSSPP